MSGVDTISVKRCCDQIEIRRVKTGIRINMYLTESEARALKSALVIELEKPTWEISNGT